MDQSRHIESMSFELSRPLAAGDEWIQFEPASLDDGGTPLRAGQFLNIGGELRIILEVGEQVVRVAALEECHAIDHYVYRPAQHEIRFCWNRLASPS